MGSTTLASFLSRLLKPDRKENVTAASKPGARKRHSAPVPSWFDVNDPAHIPPPAPASAPQSKSKRKQKRRNTTIEITPNEQEAPFSQRPKHENVDKNNDKKKQEKQNKSKKNNAQNVKKRDVAPDVDGTNKENMKKEKSVSSKKAARRHSTGLAYWFCVSAHADTLERDMKAPFPKDKAHRAEKQVSDKQGKKRDLASIPEQGQVEDHSSRRGGPKPVSLAGVIRRDGKKKKGEAKNRHSAPPDTLAVFRPKERPPSSNPHHGVVASQERSPSHSATERSEAAPSPVRSLSPAVRYRVDGTLERPYVFPSGLTFGAEGRKTHLRSSSVPTVQELSVHPGYTVDTSELVVDVHNTNGEEDKSTKQAQQRYIRTSNPNVADVSYDDFDARRAFYLKFDDTDAHLYQTSDVHAQNYYRHSMPVFPEAFDVMAPDVQSNNDMAPGLLSFAEVEPQPPVCSPGRQQRYSMPPKNDEFVYMGSRENLNVWSNFEAEHNTVGGNIDSSYQNGNHQAIKSEAKKRYSQPVHNTDYVYMGSIENIHLLNAGDKRAGCLSLKRETDDFFLTGSGAMPIQSTKNDITASNQYPRNQNLLPETENRCASSTAHDTMTYSDSEKTDFARVSLRKGESGQLEEHHQSLPELSLPVGQNSTRKTFSESNAVDSDVPISDGEHFTDEGINSVSSRFRRDPFARNLGRASCMPGNKKMFAPPPAVFSQSDSTVQFSGSKDSSSGRDVGTTGKFSSMPSGHKRFNLPPPPNYTPPREEMEDAQAQLSQMEVCHKGSQTNLQDEALYCVNMEDRDQSLTLSQAKTMRASISSTVPAFSFPDSNANEVENPVKAAETTTTHEKQPRRDAKDYARTKRLLNSSTTSSQGSDDVFKDGSASESAWPVDRFKPSGRGKYSLPGVRQTTVPSVTRPCDRVDLTALLDPIEHKPCRPAVHIDGRAEKGETPKDEGTRPFENISEVVTSTPKIVRRDPPPRDSTSSNAGETNRPVPTPRKRYSALGLCGYIPLSVTNDVSKTDSDTKRDTLTSDVKPSSPHQGTASGSLSPAIKTPPVPKKRQNLSRGHTNSDSSYSPSDCASNNMDSNRREPDLTVTLRHATNGDVNELQTGVPSVDTKLFSNASQSSKPAIATKDTLNAPPTGEDPIPTITRGNSSTRRRRGRWVSFDDTCIADDEMSCLEDDGKENDEVEKPFPSKPKRRSMRKCISVDDLLRSGSILDRSLILARKRRRRMRDRKCQSQMQLSSSEAEDAADTPGRGRQARHPPTSGDKLLKWQRGLLTQQPSLTTENSKPAPSQTSVQPEQSEHRPVKNHSKSNPDSINKLMRNPANHRLRETPVNVNPTNEVSEKRKSSPEHMKPWEIGLQNMGPGGKSLPVPAIARWRKGISTSTSKLDTCTSNAGRETVV